MKNLKHASFANPYPALTAHELGAALLPILERRFPLLASEFIGLFSHHTEGVNSSLVGLGSEFRLIALNDGERLNLELQHENSVCLSRTLALDPSTLFHEQLFGAVAQFINQLSPWLQEHHGLPPSTAFLGGWRCATHPERLNEPVIFTLPRVMCRISDQQLDFSCFHEDIWYAIDESLITFATDFTPTANPRVTGREDIPSCTDYVDNLIGLLNELAPTTADKVVIGREVKLTLERPIAPALLLRLIAPRPNPHYEYVFRWADEVAWVGISPETLLRKNGRSLVVEPLAGTRKGSHEHDKSARYRQELMSDLKELEEHETAAGLFFEQLSTVCESGSLSLRESRSVIDLGYVQHLKSLISGTVKTGLNVFDALAAVYPPATIWGKPLAACGERIRRYEQIERGFFTGGLGYFTLGDDANFALAIRTAKLTSTHIHVYAGSGIVKASDPYREWLETNNKMKPYLANEYVWNLP
ncbi:chorismate-binding protein [Pseudomonas mandelii]|jgi:isochorismate synthase EntC|uniref:chorismate-binding protein n=1 Tax=Pseudomonas mandelii TaxID=75612 RepID=UPI00209E0ADB|nr:chorismate-binding protein [Pseudomonas mandelii]MCO8310821.1 chorismate-binding protein [Pseudomonas mandelii]